MDDEQPQLGRNHPEAQDLSESWRVREFEVVADEVMGAIRELHAQGGLDDVFDRLPGSVN